MFNRSAVRFIVRVVLLSVFIFASPTHAVEKSYGNFNDVKFIRNYDGDTFTVDIVNVPDIIGSNMSIRVSNIDTPEIKGQCSNEKLFALGAKHFVHDLLSKANRIDLLNVKRGKYFRIVADVNVDGKDLSNILIDNGYAVAYNGGTKTKNWCE